MRKRLLFMVGAALLTAFMLGSCGSGKSGRHCTLTIKADYGGASIVGEPLGSGNYEEKFTVYKGTSLTCGIGGGSHMEIQEKPDDHTWIEVISLDEKGVTYLLRRDITDEGQEITANYGSETKSHDTIVYDGQCCYRTMVFSDYTE